MEGVGRTISPAGGKLGLFPVNSWKYFCNLPPLSLDDRVVRRTYSSGQDKQVGRRSFQETDTLQLLRASYHQQDSSEISHPARKRSLLRRCLVRVNMNRTAGTTLTDRSFPAARYELALERGGLRGQLQATSDIPILFPLLRPFFVCNYQSVIEITGRSNVREVINQSNNQSIDQLFNQISIATAVAATNQHTCTLLLVVLGLCVGMGMNGVEASCSKSPALPLTTP